MSRIDLVSALLWSQNIARLQSAFPYLPRLGPPSSLLVFPRCCLGQITTFGLRERFTLQAFVLPQCRLHHGCYTLLLVLLLNPSDCTATQQKCMRSTRYSCHRMVDTRSTAVGARLHHSTSHQPQQLLSRPWLAIITQISVHAQVLLCFCRRTFARLANFHGHLHVKSFAQLLCLFESEKLS